MRLYGKRATEEEITKEISVLLLGQKNDEVLSVQDVATRLGYARPSVYGYVKKGVRMGLLAYGYDGKLSIPNNVKSELIFRRFNKLHPIVEDPLVAEWKQDMLTRKQGEPLVTWKARIRILESLCNNCKIRPKDLLVSQKHTEKILRNYAQLCIEGRVERKACEKKIPRDIKSRVYTMTQTVRDFCGYYNMTWKRGVGGIMSQVAPNHGKYADKRLTEEEMEKADQFIKEKWGLDSDVYRWFWIGIESCARFSALYNMSLDYTKHVNKKTGKATYIMTAYESKTKHIKGGKWVKYITRSDTQKSIDLLKARGGTRIYESREPEFHFSPMMSKSLKEIYTFLGKTEYFEDHPTHVLRHIGAHYWLARKDYNYGLVALIGGWNTIDELRKSYGEMPPEKVLEMIENDVRIDSYPLLH